MKTHKLTKTNACTSKECINRFIEIGATGIVCLNCQEVLKKFVDKLRERERGKSITHFLISRKRLILDKKQLWN